MKVAVVGPGALGCLFAARLSRSGAKTKLIDYDPKRASRLTKSGITVQENDSSYTESLPVVTSIPSGLDLIILLTKAYSTRDLVLPVNTPVLTLQNGLGNVETLCSLIGSAHILAGTTSEAATLVEEGHTRHVATGLTQIGAWTSCQSDPAIDLLRAASFEVALTDSPGQLLWEKLAVSAGINPLTAILNVPNGELLRVKETRRLMRDLVVEAVKVAATEGYRFEHSLVETTESICEATGDNISSMLQDIRTGKPTEIEAISGEVIRRAQAASLPTQRTQVIYQLIQGLEHR
ncbi:MAG: 2-dehydropantoate 2-reductase [Candidatus Hydrogenedentes bacterium]|nr:2-dehydropantoate 2-reductase [Candidatus Hydrogenedentota bacterium]